MEANTYAFETAVRGCGRNFFIKFYPQLVKIDSQNDSAAKKKIEDEMNALRKPNGEPYAKRATGSRVSCALQIIRHDDAEKVFDLMKL